MRLMNCGESRCHLRRFRNVVKPNHSIQQSLGFSQENLQWVLSSYVLTFGCFLILAGRAADLFGRRQLFMVGLVFIVAFCVIESRVANPLVPFRLFRNRALTMGNLVTLIMIAAFEPCGFFVTLYMQRVLHYSPFATSLAFLPLLVTLVVAPILGSWLTNLRGIRFTMGSGLTALAAGMLLLARISVNASYLDTLLPGFLCIALGLGFTSVASTVAGTTNVQAQEQGLASGLINTSTQIGTALGLAILVTVAATRTSVLAQGGVSSVAALVEGFQWAFLSGALIASMGIFIVLFVNMKEIVGSGKKIADRKKVDRF